MQDRREDPVLVRRAHLARVARWGTSLGYGLFAAALALGAGGLAWGYSALLTSAISVALVVGSMLLAPCIVMNYGIRAARREEAQAAAALDRHAP